MGQNALKGPSKTNFPDNIGPYRIKKDAVNTHNGLLAVGGEAALFVAILEDPRLPQPVQKHIEFVIKQAREGISGASERLVCQGRWQMTLSASRNPHIEPVLEVMEGNEKTPARYLMQRADYGLSTYIDQVLSLEEGKQRSHIALQIGLQIAKGLAGIQRFAVEHGYHSSDIVHRDLKPANILLRR